MTAPSELEIPAAGLLKVADDLARLLEAETAFVRQMKVKEIGGLQSEKTRLAAAYQKGLTTFTLMASSRGPLPTQLKQHLLAAGDRLAKAAGENQRMLRAGQAATDRLIGIIVRKVKEQRRSTTGYTARQALPPAARLAGVALDRRL